VVAEERLTPNGLQNVILNPKPRAVYAGTMTSIRISISNIYNITQVD